MDGAKSRKRSKTTAFLSVTQMQHRRGFYAELGLNCSITAWRACRARPGLATVTMRLGFKREIGAMRSKIVSLLAVAFSFGVVQTASAADMPTKRRPSLPRLLPLRFGPADMSA